MLIKKITELFAHQPAAFDFDYCIVRSKRKSLCIQIKDSSVRILAPQRFPVAQINQFLLQKQDWIAKKLQQQQASTAKLQHFKQSGKVFCNGQLKTLVVQRADLYQITETDQQILLQIPNRIGELQQSSYIKRKLDNWFNHRAKLHFPERLALFSYQLELAPADLIIKKYKARWGSCSSDRVISLNYLLMMAPDFVIDYVIVHELCHLTHMNHSASFWALVAKHYPDYRQAKHWLKVNSHQLQAIHH